MPVQLAQSVREIKCAICFFAPRHTNRPNIYFSVRRFSPDADPEEIIELVVSVIGAIVPFAGLALCLNFGEPRNNTSHLGTMPVSFCWALRLRTSSCICTR